MNDSTSSNHRIEVKKTVLLADSLCCGCRSPCAFNRKMRLKSGRSRKMQLVTVHSWLLATLAPGLWCWAVLRASRRSCWKELQNGSPLAGALPCSFNFFHISSSRVHLCSSSFSSSSGDQESLLDCALPHETWMHHIGSTWQIVSCVHVYINCLSFLSLHRSCILWLSPKPLNHWHQLIIQALDCQSCWACKKIT